MNDLRKNLLTVSMFAIALSLVLAVLYFRPVTGLNKLETKKVESIGYVGENDIIFYSYPEDTAKTLVELLKSAKLKGFPTNLSGKYKGGGPILPIAIAFEDSSVLRVSYLFADNKTYLVVDSKWYLCDKQTLESFREMDRECYKAYKLTRNN